MTDCWVAAWQEYDHAVAGDAYDVLVAQVAAPTGARIGLPRVVSGSSMTRLLGGAWSIAGVAAGLGGQSVSAIAIDGSGDTSEFGANMVVAAGPAATRPGHQRGQRQSRRLSRV